MSEDLTKLQAIFDRIETGKRLSKQDLQILVGAVRSQQITIATGDQTVAIGGSADGAVIVTGDRNVVGDRNVIIEGANAEAIREWMGKRPRNEMLLLKTVSDEITSRLEQSLYNAVLINLAKQLQPDQVKRPWDAEIKIGTKPSQPIPPQMTIQDVFERSDVAGKLLILGDPGSGKTTTLLDLAQALVERAKMDSTVPVPVLFNLSSWKNPKQALQSWLFAELKSKYGVSEKLSTAWIEQKQLLPLLDGLDEVRPEHQESCVWAMNQWLTSEFRPVGLVVCSRREEYGTYETQLQLNGAICLQALTNNQIDGYLTSLQQTCVWQLVESDEELVNLVRTPLFLILTVLALSELDIQQWQQATSSEERVQLLFAAYVRQMFGRSLQSRTYPHKKFPAEAKTRSWLASLAKQLQQESETEFLIERMQPSQWLSQLRLQKWLYRLSSGLVVGLIFVPFGGLVYGATGLVSVLAGGLFGGFIYGLVGGFLGGLDRIYTVEALSFPPRHEVLERIVLSIKKSSKWLIFGLIYGILFGTFSGLYVTITQGSSAELGTKLLRGFVFGLIFGSIICLLEAIVFGMRRDIETRISPNQGIYNSMSNTCILITFTIIVTFLTGGLFTFLSDDLDRVVRSLQFCLLVGAFLVGGGGAFIQHLILRLILHQNGMIPWNYAQFLNYATERMFLQRIGGRYRFIHKLLQEHFAAMPLERVKGRSLI